MNLKPLNDRLVVETVEQKDFTDSGLFLPETAKEKPQEGKVLAVGPGARNKEGERIAMDVKVGDMVLYTKYAGASIKLHDKAYLLLREYDVLGIVLNSQV